MDKDPEITYFAVNNRGELITNTQDDSGPNAVTWGVFPGKEIVQPTIVETVSFLAWRDEFYYLGSEWSKCYDENSESRRLIKEISETWYLVNIVHNDFRKARPIFDLFDGLYAPGIDEEKSSKLTNGHHDAIGEKSQANGEKSLPELNGVPDGNNVVNGANHVAAGAQ
jgi:methylenetetrahydrofolate reductase (NADPH)